MLGRSPRIIMDLDPKSVSPTGASEKNFIMEKVLISHSLQSKQKY